MSESKADKIIKQVITPQKTTRRDVEFYSSGITLINLCLGGGFGKGYISNICGWESAGKTMVCCETLGKNHNIDPNFGHDFDNCESGFTIDTKNLYNYKTNFVEPRSKKVEEFMYNVEKRLKRIDKNKNFIYICDSLDGLSDDREIKKHNDDMKKIKKAMDEGKDSDIKGDYGGKAKLMSKFFRKNNAALNESKVHLMITSQYRDKIDVIYGKKENRSGGKALNFYASQIVELKVVRKLSKKVKVNDVTYEKKIGTLTKFKVLKNKLGKADRECFLVFDRNMGIDNVKSNIYFLYDMVTHDSGEIRKKDKLEWDGIEYTIKGLVKHIEDNNLELELEKRVTDLWNEIEKALIEKRKRKY